MAVENIEKNLGLPEGVRTAEVPVVEFTPAVTQGAQEHSPEEVQQVTPIQQKVTPQVVQGYDSPEVRDVVHSGNPHDASDWATILQGKKQGDPLPN